MGYILIEYFDMHSHQIIRNMKCMNSKYYIQFNNLLLNISSLSGMADLNMNLKNLKRFNCVLQNSYWSSNICVKRSTLLRKRFGTLKSMRYITIEDISKYLYCF